MKVMKLHSKINSKMKFKNIITAILIFLNRVFQIHYFNYILINIIKFKF